MTGQALLRIVILAGGCLAISEVKHDCTIHGNRLLLPADVTSDDTPNADFATTTANATGPDCGRHSDCMQSLIHIGDMVSGLGRHAAVSLRHHPAF